MQAELEVHLEEEKGKANGRNGKGSKRVKTSVGSFDLETPRDRQGSFEPEIVKKREVFLGEDLEEKIIRLYARGMSLRGHPGTFAAGVWLGDFDGQIEPNHGQDIARIGKLAGSPPGIPVRHRLSGCHFKVREHGQVQTKALYNAIGIKKDGHKELLGLYLSGSEGAKFWLGVLTDLQNRGVEDILIACIDNLSGFSEAITSLFPHTRVQSCLVHQVRNCLKYVTHQDSKPIVKDFQAIYQAPNLAAAEVELEKLTQRWKEKYPVVIRSWHNNWHKLSTCFDFPAAIRKAIYTNNPIEAYHRQIRKHTKNKGVFPSDTALLKLVYLLANNIALQWTMPIAHWSLVIQQLAIIFEDRLINQLEI